MDFGCQLYAAGKLWQENPAAFPDRIREMQFTQAEPCVFLGGTLPAQIPGIWDEETFRQETERLRSAGIGIPSVHVFFADRANAEADLRRIAEQYGIRQFVLKCPEKVDKEEYTAFAATCVRLADALAEKDAALLLHNEIWDIREKLEGQTAFEWVLNACGGKVYAQVDVGWALAGGEDPAALLWRLEDRVRSVHYKDFKKGNPPKEVLIGTGDVDTPACFQFARAHGIPQIVDMDLGDPTLLAQACRTLGGLTQYRADTDSLLCVLDTETGELRTLRRFEGIMEAPEWLKNGDELMYNAGGASGGTASLRMP